MLLLVLRKHARNPLFGQTHIYIKIRCNIPWTIILVFTIRPNPGLYILDVPYPGKNDGSKRRIYCPL